MIPADTVRALPGQRDHPLRRSLNDELHARPAQPLTPPVRLTHVVMHSGEDSAERERAHLARLCRNAGVMPPPPGSSHHVVDLGEVRVRWERHSECSTYTFFRASVEGRPFSAPAIEGVPADWVNGLPGERLAAIHVAFVQAGRGHDESKPPAAEFASGRVTCSRIAGGTASAWTDYRIRGDGYSRILVEGLGIGAREAGHQVRRLLELETYRMLAMLALPLIRELSPRLARIEQGLRAVTAGMRSREISTEADEQADLARLTELAAEIEEIAARANYRIAASRAYHHMVEQRLEFLREDRMRDYEPLGGYMLRRLRPAIDTCEAVRRRIDDVAERVSRTNALLRTRLDVKQAARSRDLLESMDRRADLQLRVEQALEAITVIAGAYYGAGLLRLLGDGVRDVVPAFAPVPVDTLVGLATPLLVLGLWIAVRGVRARVPPTGGAGG